MTKCDSAETRTCRKYGVLEDIDSDSLWARRTGWLWIARDNGHSAAFVNARATLIFGEQTCSMGESDFLFAYLDPISGYHVRVPYLPHHYGVAK